MTADTAAKKDNAFKDAAGSKIFFPFYIPFLLIIVPTYRKPYNNCRVNEVILLHSATEEIDII